MWLRAVLRIIAVGITAAFAGAFGGAEEVPKADIAPQLEHSNVLESVAYLPDGKTALLERKEEGVYEHWISKDALSRTQLLNARSIYCTSCDFDGRDRTGRG